VLATHKTLFEAYTLGGQDRAQTAPNLASQGRRLFAHPMTRKPPSITLGMGRTRADDGETRRVMGFCLRILLDGNGRPSWSCMPSWRSAPHQRQLAATDKRNIHRVDAGVEPSRQGHLTPISGLRRRPLAAIGSQACRPRAGSMAGAPSANKVLGTFSDPLQRATGIRSSTARREGRPRSARLAESVRAE